MVVQQQAASRETLSSVSIIGARNGMHEVCAFGIDQAMHTSNRSCVLVIVDSSVPVLEFVSIPPPLSNPSQMLLPIEVRGYDESNTSVSISINQQLVHATSLMAGIQSNFLVNISQVPSGDNLLQITAMDDAGNEAPVLQRGWALDS